MRMDLLFSINNRSAGVVIEGFPSTTDEAEFMATKGNYTTIPAII